MSTNYLRGYSMATPLTRKHGRRLFRDTFLAAVCVSLVACGQHSTRPDAAEDWPQFDDEAAQAFIDRCQSELDAARAQFLALETPSPAVPVCIATYTPMPRCAPPLIAVSKTLFPSVPTSGCRRLFMNA